MTTAPSRGQRLILLVISSSFRIIFEQELVIVQIRGRFI